MNTNSKEKWREILAKNIGLERKRLNLSQIALARNLGAKEGSTVSFWENGKGEFNVATLMKLCFYFNRTPDDWLTRELGEFNPPPTRNRWEETEATESEGIVNESSRGQLQPAAAQPEEAKPPKEDLQEVRRQLLKLMNKVEAMEVH